MTGRMVTLGNMTAATKAATKGAVRPAARMMPTDTPTPGTMAALVAARRAADDSVYLLLNPLADCAPEHGLSLASLTKVLGADALTTVARPDLAHSPKACPVLVRLAGCADVPAPELMELAQRLAQADAARRRRYVCGCLLSPLDGQTLADHVAARCMDFSADSPRGMSPWFEPLRLELLAASIHAETLGPLMWPIRTWLLPTSWGSLAMVNGFQRSTGIDVGIGVGRIGAGIGVGIGTTSATMTGPAAGTALQPSIQLPALARQTQRDAPLIAQLLSAWRRSLQLPLSYAPGRWQGPSLLPPQAAAQAFRWIRQARQAGLSDTRDIIVLALHQAAIHPRLLDYEPLRLALASAAPGGASTVLAAYGGHAWHRIATHLDQVGSPP